MNRLGLASLVAALAIIAVALISLSETFVRKCEADISTSQNLARIADSLAPRRLEAAKAKSKRALVKPSLSELRKAEAIPGCSAIMSVRNGRILPESCSP